MMIMIATVSQLAIAACFGFFLAKYLQILYKLPAANAALYVGKYNLTSMFSSVLQLELLYRIQYLEHFRSSEKPLVCFNEEKNHTISLFGDKFLF